ncbi:MAG: DUF4430 domain-containing protein [Clostridia bacterium]|nr:DUF4430 domain-containing protein [Clostridia bacterium]
MNNKIFKLLALLLAAAMLLAFGACSKSNNGTNNGNGDTVTDDSSATPRPTGQPIDAVPSINLTIDARNAFVHPDLPEEIRGQLANNGFLVDNAVITLQGENRFDDTFFRLMKLYGTPIVVEDGAITSISGVANGICGENSRWVVIVNGEVSETPFEELTFTKGDQVRFVYTCNGGEDLSAPGTFEYESSVVMTEEPATEEPEPETTPDPSSQSGRENGGSTGDSGRENGSGNSGSSSGDVGGGSGNSGGDGDSRTSGGH